MAAQLQIHIQIRGFEEPLFLRATIDGFEEPLFLVDKLGVLEQPLEAQIEIEGRNGMVAVHTRPA